MSPVYSDEVPTRRCPTMSGTVALCFSASARNCAASSRTASPLNAAKFATKSRRAPRTTVVGLREARRAPQLVRSADVPAPLPPWFRARVSFDMDQWGYERDLKFDLIATQHRGSGQCCDLIEGTYELIDGFNQRRPHKRPLSRFAPKAGGLFDLPSFGAVTRQNLRLVLSNISEPLSRVSAMRACSVRRGSRNRVP